MRRLVLMLLMLNLVYALWTALRPVQMPAEITGGRSYDEALVLIEEMERPLLLVEQVPAYCSALGPFTSEADLRAFADAHLTGRVWRMDAVEVELPPLFRVYVSRSDGGPAGGRPEGAALLASVREAIVAAGLGIDSYLVVGGELDGGVSLGLFAEQGNARSVYEQISGLGIAAELRAENRARTLYSIVMAGDEDSDFIQESAVALQTLDAGIGISEKLCEMIALPD